MDVHLRRPPLRHLEDLAEAQRDLALTYEPIGLTELAEPPDRYRRNEWRRILGSGDSVFRRAVTTLSSWGVQRGAGLDVFADGPTESGCVVAMSAPLPVGYIALACRVIAVVDEPDRWSFTYGTLPEHPEEGEERFSVMRTADGQITFEIVAVSRSRQRLARLAPPITRRLQRDATERYLDAMTAAVDA